MIEDAITTSLIRRVEASDEDAWKRLVCVYAPAIRRLMERCGVPDSDRDDLQNEIFSETFRSLSAFRGQHGSKSFLSWSRQIARRCISRWWKRQEKRLDHPVGGSDFLAFLNSLPDSPSADEQTELLGEYVRQLNLSARDRQLLSLYFIENRRADEVAAELGMSAVAVRKAGARLLRSIRQELDGLESW